MSNYDLENEKVLSYVIMPRYGCSLESLFLNRRFNKDSIYSLGIQMLNIFEQIHSAGYVYNDLKLDNLLFDFGVDLI